MRQHLDHFTELGNGANHIRVAGLQTSLKGCRFLRFQSPEDIKGADFLQFFGRHGRPSKCGSNV